MEFSRQEYESGLPHPPPGDLPKPGIEPLFLASPALVAGFFTTSATWEAQRRWLYNGKMIYSTGWWNNYLCTHSILGCVSKKSKNITSERYVHFNGSSSIIYFFGSLIFFKINSFFKWRIIALQNFVVFCQTSTRISHKYTYIPPRWTSLPSPSPSHPSRLIQSPRLSFLSRSELPLALSLTYASVGFHVTLSIHLALSSPLPMSISLFPMSVSPLLPCK